MTLLVCSLVTSLMVQAMGIDEGYIDVQLGVFLVLRGWLGYVIGTLISCKHTCEIL